MAQVTIGSILPVGTVLHSMLSVAQFQAQYGTNWVLADGSSCTGTKYASVTGATTLPDMRGVFLRGKNNGATRNPDGDLALGTYTVDKVGAHNHQQTTGISNPQPARYQISVGAGPAQPGIARTYTSSGNDTFPLNTQNNSGNETAPKSVTVNIFIRVN